MPVDVSAFSSCFRAVISLGPWGSKVTIPREIINFSKAMVPLDRENFETGGPGEGRER